MGSEKQNQPPQQFGLTAEGLQRLRDAADSANYDEKGQPQP